MKPGFGLRKLRQSLVLAAPFLNREPWSSKESVGAEVE